MLRYQVVLLLEVPVGLGARVVTVNLWREHPAGGGEQGRQKEGESYVSKNRPTDTHTHTSDDHDGDDDDDEETIWERPVMPLMPLMMMVHTAGGRECDDDVVGGWLGGWEARKRRGVALTA